MHTNTYIHAHIRYICILPYLNIHSCIQTYMTHTHTYALIQRYNTHKCIYWCNVYPYIKSAVTTTLQISFYYILTYPWTNMAFILQIYFPLQCYWTQNIQVHAYIYRYNVFAYMHMLFQTFWISTFLEVPDFQMFGNSQIPEICTSRNSRNTNFWIMYVCRQRQMNSMYCMHVCILTCMCASMHIWM